MIEVDSTRQSLLIEEKPSLLKSDIAVIGHARPFSPPNRLTDAEGTKAISYQLANTSSESAGAV